MSITLKKHNEETFKNVYDLFQNNNRVAVEQATGTGKSYITAKSIASISKKRTLYITSGRAIIKEFKKSLDLNNIVNMDNIDFLTYQGTLTFDVNNIKDKYDFIVLDEYHRAGAKKWLTSVTNILNSLPNAKILGTTATPIRYLDGKRNMTEEIFDNVVANQITLSRAIEENILVKPKYILGVYEYNLNKQLERFSNKKEILEKIRYLTNNFDSIYGVPKVLKKHITSERKFIIFCESTAHLNEMKFIVYKWFKQSFDEDVNIYSIHSNKKNNQQDYEEFKSATNGFNLLFVVNMLNEGVHIDVDGLIFLRGTRSAIIYYQQLGRALTSSKKTPPLVFDFVKNTQNILLVDYKDEVKNTSTMQSGSEKTFDYSIKGYFDVFDETIDFKNAIDEIELHTSGWMEKYNELAKFKLQNGNTDIPYKNTVLYRFLLLQKKKYYKGELSSDKISLLNKLDIEWDYVENKNEVQWQKRLKEISDYILLHGNIDVPRSETSLYKFISKQRSLYSKGELSQSRIEDLLKLGVSLNSNKTVKINDNKNTNPKEKSTSIWELRFKELMEFKVKHGHCNIPRNHENTVLAEWVHTQRSNKDKMPLERKEKLISLGFEFNLAEKNNEEQWELMFKRLLDYKRKFGDCKVSSRYEDTKLSNWVRTQRRAFKDGKLTKNRYNRLVEIDFTF